MSIRGEMFLTDEEIKRLTGKARVKDQCSDLDAMGIRYRVNAKNEIIVLWSAVESVLGGNVAVRAGQKTTSNEPDFSALDVG